MHLAPAYTVPHNLTDDQRTEGCTIEGDLISAEDNDVTFLSRIIIAEETFAVF